MIGAIALILVVAAAGALVHGMGCADWLFDPTDQAPPSTASLDEERLYLDAETEPTPCSPGPCLARNARCFTPVKCGRVIQLA